MHVFASVGKNFLETTNHKKMKTLTSILSVNRHVGSLFTLSLFLFTTSAIASTPIGEPVNQYTTTISSGIEYASLAANATEKTVFINWVTASEQNNSHFEVERSTDMVSFKTVAMVLDGFAATGTGKTYKFKEDAGDVRKGKTVYYRLKQVDTDNQVHYSSVMAVQLNATVTVFPKQESTINNTTSNNSNLEVIDIQKLLSKQSNPNTGI